METRVKILSAAFACSLSAVALSAHVQTERSSVVFDYYEWDFGTINPQEGTVCHTFTMKNTSKESVSLF